MMQATQTGSRNNSLRSPLFLGSTPVRCFLAEAEMRSVLVVIAYIFS